LLPWGAEACSIALRGRAALVFDALGSAPDARAYFLFCGKKKVAKGGVYRCRRQKATPGYAVGCADSPALLEGPGGCATRRCAAQTVLADCPRPFSVARRSTWGPRKASLLNGQGLNLNLGCFRSARFAGPLGRRRATQALADKGRALSEGQSPELRSPRQGRVAQGTRAAGADLGSPSSLATFCLAKQEESTPAGQRRNPADQQAKTPARQARKTAPNKNQIHSPPAAKCQHFQQVTTSMNQYRPSASQPGSSMHCCGASRPTSSLHQVRRTIPLDKNQRLASWFASCF